MSGWHDFFSRGRPSARRAVAKGRATVCRARCRSVRPAERRIRHERACPSRVAPRDGDRAPAGEGDRARPDAQPRLPIVRTSPIGWGDRLGDRRTHLRAQSRWIGAWPRAQDRAGTECPDARSRQSGCDVRSCYGDRTSAGRDAKRDDDACVAARSGVWHQLRAARCRSPSPPAPPSQKLSDAGSRPLRHTWHRRALPAAAWAS